MPDDNNYEDIFKDTIRRYLNLNQHSFLHSNRSKAYTIHEPITILSLGKQLSLTLIIGESLLCFADLASIDRFQQ